MLRLGSTERVIVLSGLALLNRWEGEPRGEGDRVRRCQRQESRFLPSAPVALRIAQLADGSGALVPLRRAPTDGRNQRKLLRGSPWNVLFWGTFFEAALASFQI